MLLYLIRNYQFRDNCPKLINTYYIKALRFNKQQIPKMNKASKLNQSVNQIEHYKVELKLSDSTAQANVYLCKDEDRLYAIKVFFKLNSMEIQRQFLSGLSSEYIVHCFGSNQRGKVYFQNGQIEEYPILVLEFIDGGNLYDFISSCGRLPQHICRAIFEQMIEGIEHTHQKNICHLDIKPQNILISLSGQIKFADFGLSSYNHGQTLTRPVGTDIYWAPQMHRNSFKGEKVDIFALGMMLYIIMIGQRPFSFALLTDRNYSLFRRNNLELYWNKVQSKFKNFQKLSQPLKDLFVKLFSYIPEKRPTLKELKQCQWMQGKKASPEELRAFLLEANKKILDESQIDSLPRKIYQTIQKLS